MPNREEILSALGEIIIEGKLAPYNDDAARSLKRKLKYAFTPIIPYPHHKLEKLLIDVTSYLARQDLSKSLHDFTRANAMMGLTMEQVSSNMAALMSSSFAKCFVGSVSMERLGISLGTVIYDE